MRRGEALALRWRDVDLDGGRLKVRRGLGVVKSKGVGEQPGARREEAVGIVEIDVPTRRLWRTQRCGQIRIYRAGPAQLGEQRILRPVEQRCSLAGAVQTCSALTCRLGSLVDWRRNSSGLGSSVPP